jgi:hypothetical protein
VRANKPLEMDEHIMTLQEWNHDWDSDMEDAKMVFGGYENRKRTTNAPNKPFDL